MNSTPVFRFAPSPNGALHLGHAYSALLNFELAGATGGQFIIRVEDIDLTRCTPTLEEAMLDDLAWLGLQWKTPVLRQSDRFTAYQAALNRLKEMDLVYPAFLSRGEIKRHASEHKNWPVDPDGSPRYPGIEKHWNQTQRETAIESGKPFSWRLDMEKALDMHAIENADAWGDVILARKDTPTSYNLAVVVDDAHQKVSHVVRGKDIEAATPVHQLLHHLMNLPSPIYFHHRLILDSENRKLSKSDQSTSLASLRKEAATPDDIRRLVEWDPNEVADLVAQCT